MNQRNSRYQNSGSRASFLRACRRLSETPLSFFLHARMEPQFFPRRLPWWRKQGPELLINIPQDHVVGHQLLIYLFVPSPTGRPRISPFGLASGLLRCAPPRHLRASRSVRQPFENHGTSHQLLAHLDKGPHDIDAHRHRLWASQDVRRHHRTMLGECPRPVFTVPSTAGT